MSQSPSRLESAPLRDYKRACKDNSLRASSSSMAPPNPINSPLKLHELYRIAPPPSSPKSSFSPTFFDLLWLKMHPVEHLFFFSLPHLHPSSFFDNIVPKLKRSLSLALQHFLPLAGNIVWPSNDSLKPIIQYNPGDSIFVAIDVSDSDMNSLLDKSPRDASQSRPFVPNLDSSDSSASVLSLQITLFPTSGFSIGMTSHHACADGKSSTMFIKAWAYLCRTQAENESCGLLPQELEPFLDREVILDPHDIASVYMNAISGSDPTQKKKPSLKVISDKFRTKVEDSARATFELNREDLNKIKESILQKWENHKAIQERADSNIPKPQTLSTFVVTSAYVWIILAKAIERTEQRTKKILLGFTVDCRTRLELPISDNFFGNCVMPQFISTLPENPSNIEDGVVIAAKEIQRKISKIRKERGALDGAETLFCKFSLLNQVMCIGVAGSTRFGVYQTDFGWGRPEKVEITSIDRNITMGMAESKDGDNGVEVGLVLKKHLMDHFASLFQRGIECF